MSGKIGKKAILAVSFGTSFSGTREKTIDRIEQSLGEAFPERAVYRAWTSGKIIAGLRQRDGICVHTVREALEQLADDGIADLLVQPTHMIGGIENDRMLAEIRACASRFARVAVGDPLLSDKEDCREALRAVLEEFSGLTERETLVLMGHGSRHAANSVYACLNGMLRETGSEQVILGTVEARPNLEDVLERVRALAPEKVILAPFMVVAGEHAQNDMAGGGKDSWKSRIQSEGFPVECRLQGLGEYEGIRRIYVRHAREAKELLKKRF